MGKKSKITEKDCRRIKRSDGMRMKTVKGKKQYGYLDRHTKAKVDTIVKRIVEDERIGELYELWYQCQCEIYRTYTDVMPPRRIIPTLCFALG